MFKAAYNLYLSGDKKFARKIKRITGYPPREVFLYRLALRHSSLVKKRAMSARECNERLEFLGDTILDSAISDYLFRIYPTQDEGFLTEMRSKIVNRESLNDICRKLKIDSLIRYQKGSKGQVSKYMYGDALEAFIGAVYLDQGYKKTKRFILNKIIANHIDLHAREQRVYNYKSVLLEYVQKEKLEEIEYELVAENGKGKSKHFVVQVRIGTRIMGKGEGRKKKDAEQQASENALLRMNLIDPGNGSDS